MCCTHVAKAPSYVTKLVYCPLWLKNVARHVSCVQVCAHFTLSCWVCYGRSLGLPSPSSIHFFAGLCKDVHRNCALCASFCTNSNFSDLMVRNCRRTCKFCTGSFRSNSSGVELSIVHICLLWNSKKAGSSWVECLFTK